MFIVRKGSRFGVYRRGLPFETVFGAELLAGVRRVDAEYQFVLGFHRHDVDRRADGAQLFVSCHFLALFNAYRPHVGIGVIYSP